jgi:hypothetical protein
MSEAIAVGAAIFVDMANRFHGHGDGVHVAAYGVSDIGFLNAGVIMCEEDNVRGLNTAATLWGQQWWMSTSGLPAEHQRHSDLLGGGPLSARRGLGARDLPGPYRGRYLLWRE